MYQLGLDTLWSFALQMYQLGLDSPVVTYSLQLDQLCISLVVFISFLKKMELFLMRAESYTYILIFLSIENTIRNDMV